MPLRRIKRMFDEVKKAVGLLEKVVEKLDPDVLDPRAAVTLMSLLARGEKLCAAGKSLAASQVAASGTWRRSGDRTAAHFVARTTGDLVGETVVAIETAMRIKDLPATDKAYRSGELTQDQAAEIASAAALAPQAEESLLDVAQSEGTARLRQVSAQVKAAACKDEAERAERLHRQRSVRTWTESDGAIRLDARLTPEAGAQVKSVLDVLREERFLEARRQGRRESYEALQADALEEMAIRAGSDKGESVGSKATVMVRVDFDALKRGYTKNGEVCEIPGVGPISVAAARTYLGEGFYKLLVTKGKEVLTVTSLSRYIPSSLGTVLIERDPECVVEGCHETKRLEIDHVIDYTPDGPTCLDNLVRLCSHHHRLKTHKNYQLERRPKGKWRLNPPETKRARASP